MKLLLSILLILASSINVKAQYEYEPSEEYPFGKIHPHAPKQLGDYALLVGESRCVSVSMAPDQTWNPEVDMIWRFKYIMNGMALQDETLKSDGIHSGSIRQFNRDSTKWYVQYYTSGSIPATLPTWEGGKTEEDTILLYRAQKSPNGLEGFYRITFYDISESSFNWIGEWVNKDETIVFPTWKISCTKIES